MKHLSIKRLANIVTLFVVAVSVLKSNRRIRFGYNRKLQPHEI
jgi:hypothetical protein